MSSIFREIGIHKKLFITSVICLAIALYFIIYTIFGNRGVVDYFKLSSDLQQQSLVKDKLSIDIQNQKNLVNGMQNESLDLDLLDEQVRKNLGYAKDDEIVIYQEERPTTTQKE